MYNITYEIGFIENLDGAQATPIIKMGLNLHIPLLLLSIGSVSPYSFDFGKCPSSVYMKSRVKSDFVLDNIMGTWYKHLRYADSRNCQQVIYSDSEEAPGVIYVEERDYPPSQPYPDVTVYTLRIGDDPAIPAKLATMDGK